MQRAVVLALVAAVLLHGAILLFGGLVLFPGKGAAEVRENVDLLSEAADEQKDDKKDEDKPKAQENEAEEAQETLTAAQEPLPDLKALEAPTGPANGPALAALSLADLEGALNGAAAGGEGFGGGSSLASGGRIGASGAGGGGGGELDGAFSIADLDQRPRAVLQTAPSYPVDLRRRKVEGSVQVVFVVDVAGKVSNARVETSTNPAFERPALEAVRQWKFEPGTRAGHRVNFKMRVPITFNAG